MISKAYEEYLMNIYILKMKGENVRVTDIAKKMYCSKPSVNKALNNLKSAGLIHYQSYGSIELTQDGIKLAKKILEAYDIVYLFLSEVLNLETNYARQEAEKLKQSMSDKTLNELAKYVYKVLGLGNLNCDYNINNESCRTCIKKGKMQSLLKSERNKDVYEKRAIEN